MNFSYPTHLLSLQNRGKIQTSRIFKELKYLAIFACKSQKTFGSDDYWRNKMCIVFRLDVVNDVNINNQTFIERLILSFYTRCLSDFPYHYRENSMLRWGVFKVLEYMDRVKRIWYLSPMRAVKVQASLRIRAVSPEPPLLAHTSSESRGTFRQKARSLAPLSGWACAIKICHDGMLEDTNSLDGAHMVHVYFLFWSISVQFGTDV